MKIFHVDHTKFTHVAAGNKHMLVIEAVMKTKRFPKVNGARSA
jgi:hypothetical protein